MREKGVIVAAGVPLADFGRDGDHLQIGRPFTTIEEEISVIVEAPDDALDTVLLQTV